MFPILVYTTLRSCFSSGFAYLSFADSSSNHSPFLRQVLCGYCVWQSTYLSGRRTSFFMDFILCLVYSSSLLILLILLYLYLVVIFLILGMKVKRAISRVSMVYYILFCLFDCVRMKPLLSRFFNPGSIYIRMNYIMVVKIRVYLDPYEVTVLCT